MAPVNSRDYVLSECGRCATHNVACQHSQQTRRWSNAGSMLANHLRRWPSIKPALVQRLVFTGLRTGGQYKPTPVQCLLNIEPASVLDSIHSALVSTLCQIYWPAKSNHTNMAAGWVYWACVENMTTRGVVLKGSVSCLNLYRFTACIDVLTENNILVKFKQVML